MPALPLSRYEFASVHQDEQGRTFLDVPDPISRRPDRNDGRVTLGEGDSLESLAWSSYLPTLDRNLDIRPSGFFWVIGQFNDVVDATERLPTARTFRIPGIQRLSSEITASPQFYSPNEVV